MSELDELHINPNNVEAVELKDHDDGKASVALYLVNSRWLYEFAALEVAECFRGDLLQRVDVEMDKGRFVSVHKIVRDARSRFDDE